MVGSEAVAQRILVAEDDLELLDILLSGLRRAGFEARGTSSGSDLLKRAADYEPHALVVDVGLPDADGRDLCQALRAQGVEAPVVFLTALNTRADRLSGFSAGGDDYITKPFDFEELLARLAALIRRSGGSAVMRAGGLRLDPVAHSVRCGTESVALTPTEFRLLAALAARPGEAVRRGALRAAAWPQGAMVHDNTLDVYLARLRRKLGGIDEAPELRTVYGVGYSLAAGPAG
jgi:two-component system OmpR family response regulator